MRPRRQLRNGSNVSHLFNSRCDAVHGQFLGGGGRRCTVWEFRPLNWTVKDLELNFASGRYVSPTLPTSRVKRRFIMNSITQQIEAGSLSRK